MPSKPDPYQVELPPLLAQTLQTGLSQTLENYLTTRSNLPGPRMNTALVSSFARLIGQIVTQPNSPVARLEAMLDSWASLTLEAAPINQPAEILPATAVMSYGQVAVARPDWWEDEAGKLKRAASNPRWRVREIVAAALQQMLKADWVRTYALLQSWVSEPDPLLKRAVVAAIAEPPLLTSPARGEQALALQTPVVEWLAQLPAEQRRSEAFEVLRKALGYTLSVAIAAAPAPGLILLEKLTASSDRDISWIGRKNMTKKRLEPYLGGISKN